MRPGPGVRAPTFTIAIRVLRDYVRQRGPETLPANLVTQIQAKAQIEPFEAESPSVARSLEQTLRSCDDTVKQHGYRAGVDALNKAVENWGRDRRILAHRGYLKYRLRDNVGAKKDLRAAIDAGHENADVYLHLGLVHYYSHEDLFAENCARRALSIRPGFEKAERLLGDCLLTKAKRELFTLTEPQRKQMLQEAEEHLRNALYRDEATQGQRKHNEAIHARLANLKDSL